MRSSLLLAAAGLLLAACGGGKGKGAGGAPAPIDAGDATVDVSPPDAAAADVQAADAAAADLATTDASEPDLLPDAGPPAVKSLHAGLSTTCALFTDGRIKCWGANGSGQLGLGDKLPRGDRPATMGANLPFVDLGPARVVDLAVGAVHVCALLEYGQVSCWGDNTHGQLGAGIWQSVVGDQPDELGEKLPQIDFGPGRRATAIAVGPRHSCAVLDGGQVKCWGDNFWGNLGIGDLGAWPPEPGPWRPAVDLGAGRHAVAVAAGGAFTSTYNPSLSNFFGNSAFTCALLDDLQGKCWGGRGTYGALGAPAVDQRGTKPEGMGDNMPPLPLGGHPIRQLVMGAGHGCALLDNQQIRCWGNQHQDQTGRSGTPGTEAEPYPPVNFGPGRAATAVAVSVVTPFIDEAHSCAVLDDGSATCWGANWHGQLGQPGCPGSSGGSTCRGGTLGGPLPAINLGAGARVKAIAPGGQHTCALLEDGRVKCWGAGGVLGLEDTNTRGMQPADMGDNLPAVSL